MALGVLAEQAGIPAGVIQVVTGKSSVIGEILTGDARIHKLSFTGSTEVGRTLMAQCAPTIKKLSLELGGNAPFIVFDDADLEKAATGLIASKYRNAGQTCVCANRVYVQDSIKDKFLDVFVKKVAELKVGNGLEEGVDIGPLINKKALDKVQALLKDALDKGAKLVTGGSVNAASELTYNPTVITDTIYGLAAYFYSSDYARSWRVTEGLEYGIIGHNTGLISTEVAPFGGVKQSGFGREGSKYGIEDYITTKYWCSDIS